MPQHWLLNPANTLAHQVWRLSFTFTTVFVLSSLTPPSAEAALTKDIAGIWQIKGRDAKLGSYQGLVELKENPKDKSYSYTRVISLDDYRHRDGRGIDWVWTGKLVENANEQAELQIKLQRGDFISQVDNFQRSLTDRSALQIIGSISGNQQFSTIHFSAAADSTFASNETAVWLKPSDPEPLWRSERSIQDSHADLTPFKADSSLGFILSLLYPKSLLNVDALQSDPHAYLFNYFADYHQFPAIKPYTNNAAFQRAVHGQIIDHTDFDYYQQQPKRLRVINKVIDPISLAETEVRANAFSTSPAEKQIFYQAGLNGALVGAHGMVVKSILASGEEVPDADSALWTGVYCYSQALRYKLSGDEAALNNLRRSLVGVLNLMNITRDSKNFARTMRPHRPDVAPPWHAGDKEYAAFDWLEGGNNDMANGLILAMIAGWEVLPADDYFHSAISSHAKRLLNLNVFQPDIGDLGTNAAMALLMAGISNNNLLAYTYVASAQSLLRNPTLKLYNQSAGGTFYLFGISDWSGNHLTLTSNLAMQRLLAHTNASDLLNQSNRAAAASWKSNFRQLDMPLQATMAAAVNELIDDPNARQTAFSQINWGLRSFPVPKPVYAVDHRLNENFIMSPFPALAWKSDWRTNSARQQSLNAYPLFEQAVDDYQWNDNLFLINTGGAQDRQVPGVDYLFFYWQAESSKIDCLLNWGEKTYPQLFAPAAIVSKFSKPYIYRYYRDTRSSLYVSSLNKHLYYQGINGVLTDVGNVNEWLGKAGCQ